jgi:hypothetical protein
VSVIESRPRGGSKRRSDPLVLVVTGVAVLAAAWLALLAVLVTHVGGYDWPEDAVVRFEGQAQVVAVRADRDAMIWTEGGTAAGDCTVTDAGTGSVLPERPVEGSYQRDGKVADWVGIATVAPESSSLSVTCAGVRGTVVAVQAVPRLPASLSGLSAWLLVPAVFAAAGLAWLGAGIIAAARVRSPRRRRAAARRS